MSPAPSRTILVVDDNADDRASIRRLLSRDRPGYVIVEAATGAEGLDQIRAARPDCVLLDFYLPDMDGAEFLWALKRGSQDRRSMPVPVVLLTAVDRDSMASGLLGMGAQDYLVKDNVSAGGLARAVENAIEKYQIQRELEDQRIKAEYRSRKLDAIRAELQDNLAELSDAQKARERFLAVMSHEMRTPLNAIMGYTDLLDMELDGPLTEGQRGHLARIRVGSRHLLDLINDVLDLARADANKLELDLRPVGVLPIIEEVVALLQPQAEVKDVALRIEHPAEPLPLVQADLQRLRQILMNLVSNAIKFTDDGSVTIRVDAMGESLNVHVADTGIGIDPDVLPLVFDDFFQAKGELTREKGGSGLGLAIARRLAALMGGSITAVSEIGRGSTFTITLRVVEGQRRAEDIAHHAARMGTLSPRRPAPSAVTVVAFGADEAALAALEQHVHPGVRLVWTTVADEVPALARSEQAVLVLLDMGNQPERAWRAAHVLQDVPELAHTAVLLLPAIPSGGGDASGGLDLGWVSLVPKPFTSEQLTRAVAAAAGRDEAGNPATCTVLIVDDDPDSRRVAAKFLIDADVTVREVGDGESALIEMRRSPPDVVILDLMMPVLDGFGVLAAMRTDPQLAGVPVVVLTAKSLTDAERQFLARSAVHVLQKGEYRLADVAALVLRAARAPDGPA